MMPLGRYPEIVLASRFGLLVASVWLILFVHLWRQRNDLHWIIHLSYLSMSSMLFGLAGWVVVARRLDGAFIMLISFAIALSLGPLLTMHILQREGTETPKRDED